MFIVWIRKSKEDSDSHTGESEEASFWKHDECMRQFRLAHPKIETTKSKDVRTADLIALVPMKRVELARHSQN